MSDFDILGREVHRNFSVVFKSQAREEVIACLLRSRKNSAGEWQNRDIMGVQGEALKLYFGPDKSDKVRNTARVTRKTAEHLRSVYANITFGERREDGIILAEGVKLAAISTTRDNASIQWNPNPLASHEMDKDALNVWFQNTFNIQWCS